VLTTALLLGGILAAAVPTAQSATLSKKSAVHSALTGDSSIASTGPLTNIAISPDLNCAVNHTGDLSGEWFGDTACGTLVSAGGTLYGPAEIPAGGSATGVAGYTPFTPVSQVGPTGSGTTASPFTIVTVVSLGTSGLTLTETDRYVTGQETYRTDVHLAKTGGTARSVIIYRAGDCFLQDSDFGLGAVSGSTVTCKALSTSSDPNRIEQLLPLTAGNRYLEDFYNTVWATIGAQTALPNTCTCSDAIDNGEALSWSLNLAVGAASTTVSNLTVFSPVGAEPLRVSKTADIGSVPQGAPDGYTITVRNPGVVAETLSSIIDSPLPSGFTYTAGSTTGATTSNPTINGSTLTWHGSFTVPASGSLSLHFRVTVSHTSGTYLNSAGAAGTGLTVIGSGPTASVRVGSIDHPTTCVVTALRAGPPKQQDVTVTDPDGLARIFNVHIVNGTVAVPAFTLGTTGPVVLTATKTDQSLNTFWEFDVTGVNGVTKHCV
jgi:hypothetical protein